MPSIAAPSLLHRYASFIVRNRWLVLALVLTVTSLLAIGVTRIHVEVDPDRQLPQDHPYIQALNESHRLFGDKNLVVVGLHPKNRNPFTPPFLAKVKDITDRIAQIPGIVTPLLQSVAAPSVKDVYPAEDGLRVRPLMPEPPTTTAEAEAVRRHLLDDPSYVGTFVSYDGTSLALYATFDLTPELPGYVNIHRAVLQALEESSDGSFTYSLSGPVVIASALSLYAGQMAYLFPIALLVIGVIHYDAFRTFQAVALPLVTGLLAVTWAIGLMGLVGVPLDPFNATTPVLILAVAAGHAVQILKRFHEEFARTGDTHPAIIESIAKVGGVMIAAGTIAALSFASLATLGTDSMRTFGVFTAFGILSALVIEMTTIPALRAILPTLKLRESQNEALIHPWLNRWLGTLGQTLIRPSSARTVLLIYASVVLVSILLAQRIQVDTSFKRTLAPNDRIRVDDDLLNRLFAGTNLLVFSIEGPSEGSIAEPAALRGIDAFERRIESLPGAGKALSIVDTIRRLHRAINPESPRDSLPDSKDLVTQYLFLYTLSGGDDLSSRLTSDNRIAKVVLMLHDDSTRYGETIIAMAKQIAAEELPAGYRAHVSGPLASNSALTEAIVHGKILNIAQIATITILVAALILRSWLGGLLVAVPLAIAVLMNFGAMGALRIPLDVSTAAVTAMAVGIGADYAVYFLFRLREEYAVDANYDAALARTLFSSGKAIVFVSSAVALGYSVLCLSGFRLFVQLGSLVGMAMVTSSLATLIVLPALLTLISASSTPWLRTVLGASQGSEGTPHRSAKHAAGS